MSVREQIIRQFGLPAESIDDETPLFSSGLLDSFNMIELVGLVEEQMGKKLRVADINLENLDSVRRIESLIKQARA
jgi:acyl carrier protein